MAVIRMINLAHNIWDEEKCPYDSTDDICKASDSKLKITPEKRSGICRTDNYDNCTRFLIKCLQNQNAA